MCTVCAAVDVVERVGPSPHSVGHLWGGKMTEEGCINTLKMTEEGCINVF
jgi:hypothetical protein